MIMRYTENYNLKKPEELDPVDIQDLNYNADVIDSKLKEVEDWKAAHLQASNPHSITPALIGAETPTGAQQKANQAETNAKSYADNVLNSAKDYADDVLESAKSYADQVAQEIIDARQGKASLGANLTAIKDDITQLNLSLGALMITEGQPWEEGV